MYAIEDISGRKYHTRWGKLIPKKEIVIDNLKDFFGVDRTEENILENLKADPNIEINIVEKAKIVEEKPKVKEMKVNEEKKEDKE